MPIGTRVRVGRTVLVLLDATLSPPEDPLPPPPDVPGLVVASSTMQDIGRTVERLAACTGPTSTRRPDDAWSLSGASMVTDKVG